MTPDLVDAEPVRRHLERLLELGMTQTEIARAAQCDRSRVSVLVSGKKGVPVVETQREVAERMMRVDCSTLEVASSWRARAQCATPMAKRAARAVGVEVVADLFYPDDDERGDLHRAVARELCAQCPVAAECQDYATGRHESGIWAGTEYDQETE